MTDWDKTSCISYKYPTIDKGINVQTDLLLVEPVEEKPSLPKPHLWCSKAHIVSYCSSCGKMVYQKAHCYQRYCKKCFKTKFHRCLKRLKTLNIKTSRLFHFSIGFPKQGFTKERKKHVENIIRKFKQHLKRHYNIKIMGIKCFDLSVIERVHFHFACLPNGVFKCCAHIFNRTISKVSNGELTNVAVFGYRSKKGLFSYIAKRCSGLFGDGKIQFFIQDRYTHEEYEEKFKGLRFLTGFARRLVYIEAPDYHNIYQTCPLCNAQNSLMFIEIEMSVERRELS